MTSAWSQLEQMLTCAICLDKFKNPRLLPCQHSFCGDSCMDGLVDYARRQIKCPECRAEHRIPYQGVQSLPLNVTLIRFLELHARITGEEPEPVPTFLEKCSVCGEKVDGVQRCAHCDKKVCPECKEAHVDLLRREIGRINGQSRRCLSKLAEFVGILKKSEEKLKTNTQTVKREIEDSCKRLISDLESKQRKLLEQVDLFADCEQKTIDKLKVAVQDELDTLESNLQVAEERVQSSLSSGAKANKYQWTDSELSELKDIYNKSMEFIRLFDPEIGDYTRKIRFNLIPEFESMRRRICELGELKFGESALVLIVNSFQYCNATGSVAQELSNQLAASNQMIPSGPGQYGLSHSSSNANIISSATGGGQPGAAGQTGASNMLELPGMMMQNALMRSQSDHRLASQFQQRLKQQEAAAAAAASAGGQSGRYGSSVAGRDYETEALRSRYGPGARGSNGGGPKDYTNDLLRDWPRPSDNDSDGLPFGSSIQFKSAFMRRKEKERQHQYGTSNVDDDDDLTSEASYGGVSGRNVRFHESSVAGSDAYSMVGAPAVKQKLFDCKEVEHAPLSGVPKLEGSPHLHNRLHQMGAKAIVDEKQAEEQGRRDKDLMESARQAMTLASQRVKQLSEDEIEKQKQANKQQQQQLQQQQESMVRAEATQPASEDATTTTTTGAASSTATPPSPATPTSGVPVGNRRGLYGQAVTEKSKRQLSSAIQDAVNYTRRRSNAGGESSTEQTPVLERDASISSAASSSTPAASGSTGGATRKRTLRSSGRSMSKQASQDRQQSVDGSSGSGGPAGGTQRRRRTLARSESSQQSVETPLGNQPTETHSKNYSIGSGDHRATSTGLAQQVSGRHLAGEGPSSSSASSSPLAGRSSPKLSGAANKRDLLRQQRSSTATTTTTTNDQTSTTTDEDEPQQERATSLTKRLNDKLKSSTKDDDDDDVSNDDENVQHEDTGTIRRAKPYSSVSRDDETSRYGRSSLYSGAKSARSSRLASSSDDDEDADDIQADEDEELDEEDDEDEEDNLDGATGRPSSAASRRAGQKRNSGNRRSREFLPNAVNKLLDRSAQIRRDSQEQRSRGDSPQRSSGPSASATTSGRSTRDYTPTSSSYYPSTSRPSAYSTSTPTSTGSSSALRQRLAYQRSQSIRDREREDDTNNSNNSIYTTASSGVTSTTSGRRSSNEDNDGPYIAGSYSASRRRAERERRPSGSSSDRTLTSMRDVDSRDSTGSSSRYASRRDSSGGVDSPSGGFQSRFLSKSRTSAALSTLGAGSSSRERSHADYEPSTTSAYSSGSSASHQQRDSSPSSRSYLSSRDRFMQSPAVASTGGPGTSSASSTSGARSHTGAPSAAPPAVTSMGQFRHHPTSNLNYHDDSPFIEFDDEDDQYSAYFPSAGTISHSEYLRNKFGERRTSSNSSSASGPGSLIRSRSSAYVKSQNDDVDDYNSADGKSDEDCPIVRPVASSRRSSLLSSLDSSGGPSAVVSSAVYSPKGRMLFKLGSRGNGPGSFTWPRGVAVGSVGFGGREIVVADSSNHRVQVFDTTGRFLREFGTYGSAEGEFDCLAGVALDPIKRRYVVSDRYNHRVQIFDHTGRFLSSFGDFGKERGGRFNLPWGVACDPSGGRIYVCDKENHRVQIFDLDGTFIDKFGSQGTGPGQLQHPHYLAVGGGKLVVTDTNNHRVQVFDLQGRLLRTIGRGEGSLDGQFKFPRGVAMDDQKGYVIVGDSGNNRLQIFNLTDGAFVKSIGTWGSGEGEFKGIEGVALDPTTSSILVCDRENHRIQVF